MGLYGRFLVTLAVGLCGVTMVLTVLMDQLFNEWDMFADLAEFLRDLSKHRGRRWERADDEAMQDQGGIRWQRPARVQELDDEDLEPSLIQTSAGLVTITPLPRPRLPKDEPPELASIVVTS